MAVDHNNPQSRDEEILIATIDGTEYNKNPQSRMEELLLELKEVIEEGGGGGGTSDYENLTNQPQVNGETLIGDKSGADLGLVDAEEGKGLSTNDYDDTEKAAVAAATSAISAMQDGSDIDSFGDVEVALLDKQDKLTAGEYIQFTNDEISVKRDIAYEADEVLFAEQTNEGLHVVVTVGSATLYEETFVSSDPNHTVLDLVQTSFSVRAVRWVVEYLKASKTQSAGYETIVWPSLTDTFVTTVDADKKLIIQSELDAAIDSAVSKCYHHAGTKTCAELLPTLLIAANEGNVYEMTDSGTTTSDFMEGIGHPIKEGDNVGVARVSEGVYKFDLLSGFVDTSNFVQKSSTAGLIMNDGTIDTVAKQPATDNNLTTTDKTTTGAVNELKSGLTTLDDEVNGDATTYPYADVITIPDAVPSNLADCKVKIEPVQDLHGYDKPWVGGAGKNKCQPRTTGTTFNGITVTPNEDGSISYVGTATITGTIRCQEPLTIRLKAGTYTKSINTNDIQSAIQYGGNEYTNDTFTLDVDTDVCLVVQIVEGVTYNSKVYPQIETGSMATTWEPWSNICPITGHTEASVEVTDGDETTKTYTIALGDTIYGGTVDFDSGVMKPMWASEVFDGTQTVQNVTRIDNVVRGQFIIQNSATYPHAISSYLEWVNDWGLDQPHFYIYDNKINVFLPIPNDGTSTWDSYLASNPLQVCYPLATPTTIQLTPQQIQLLKGTNTLTASTGQISVTANGVSGSIGSVQTQANATDAALAELAADIAEQLPDAPTTDGAYVLTVTVANGTPTYSWESAT